MAIVIEELDVQTQPQPAAPSSSAAEGQGGGSEVDERALQAALAREAWRRDRLAADWWDPLESTCRHASLSIL